MIAMLSTPSIVKIIEKNKVNNYNNTIDSIINAASLYTSNNRYELNFVDSSGNSSFCKPNDVNDIYTSITLKDLIDSGDISSPIENFCTDEEFSNSTEVKIILNCKTRQFDYKVLGLTEKENITDFDGKIIDGKTCDDLY